MKRISVLLFVGCILSSIGSAQESEPITITFKNSNFDSKFCKLSDVADEISYIKLETTPDVIIGRSGGYTIEQIPNGFLLWNVKGAGRIMLFNTDGKFRGFVGREGKGPGEYYGVYKVLYDKFFDNVLVLINNKVLKYDLNGDFISSVNIDKKLGWLERFCVKDNKTWLFTYKYPLEGNLFEVGVMATNKEGRLIKKYNLTDEDSPGSYNWLTQMNFLYHEDNGTYFTPFDYFKTYKLNKEDRWVPYVIIDVPFKTMPLDVYKKSTHLGILSKAQQDYQSQIWSALIFADNLLIHVATPKLLYILADIKTGDRLYYGFDMEFRKFGIKNDLDGGMPYFLRGYNNKRISLELVDALDLLDFSDKGLLKPDGKDHGPYMNLKEVLESTKPDDNPIIVVVHMKE